MKHNLAAIIENKCISVFFLFKKYLFRLFFPYICHGFHSLGRDDKCIH